MKILLIFTLSLISDGEASKEVTGYSGGGVLINCKYDTEYTQNKKYFCKGSAPGCSDQIKTGAKDVWINSGRFSLFDDTKLAEFRVMIRELTVQDAGTYQCGVDKHLKRDICTPVKLQVKKDGGASKEVTGYSGGGVLIKCKYDTEYTQSPTFFCKGSAPRCSEQIKTGSKNKWINSGRFSLFDDTKSAEFRVMIRELTVQDAGMYHCGVHRLDIDIYTPVEINIKEDLSYEKSISTTVYAGGDLNIGCKSPESLISDPRFLCKRLQNADCSYKATDKKSRQHINKVLDEKEILTVIVRDVTVEDSAEYWCGAEVNWKSDSGYKVYFTQIKLTVIGFLYTTVIIVSVSLLVFLVGIIFLIVTLHKRCKTQGPEKMTQTYRETKCYENDPNVFRFQSGRMTNQSHSVYQSLNAYANPPDSVYQSLNSNTNQLDSVSQSLEC